MTKLVLKFFDEELAETEFQHPLVQGKIRSVRGKTSGAFQSCGTFQWTSAVQALSMLLLKTAAATLSKSSMPYIAGGAGSPAASLDYSISKGTLWISDMFGTDSQGNSIIKNVVKRSNPNQRRPGPVFIAINYNFLPPTAIEICSNSILLKWNSSALNLLIQSVEKAGEQSSVNAPNFRLAS